MIPETPSANQGGTILEAVTKDQLNTGLDGPDPLPGLARRTSTPICLA